MIKPASLDLRELLRDNNQLQIESFSDHFFKGVSGYNRLMLSEEFYERFAKYDYILVHQLDAFVFSDELLAWCRRDYDYVGAPWLPSNRVPNWYTLSRAQLRRIYYRWARKTYRDTKIINAKQYAYSVGNGGFSLRRTKQMLKVLQSLSARADRYRNGDLERHHEDIFFCVEANRYFHHVKLPNFREAAAFSWELQPAVARELNRGKLPFGCHAWNKMYRDEWRPIFENLGYRLDEILP